MSLKRSFSKVTTVVPTKSYRARLGYTRSMVLSRRKHNRTAIKSRRTVSIPRLVKYISDQPFPQAYNNIFRYVSPTSQLSNGGAGADVVDIVFAGNDIWDPYTGVGNYSVSGWDEAKLIWGRYKVLASRITVTAGWKSATDDRPIDVVVFPSDYATAITTAEVALNSPRSVHMVLDAGQNSKTIKSYATSKAMFGVKDVDDHDYSGDYLTDDTGNSPAKQWFWHVCFVNKDSTTWLVNNMAVVEYYTVSLSPRTLVPPDPVEA